MVQGVLQLLPLQETQGVGVRLGAGGQGAAGEVIQCTVQSGGLYSSVRGELSYPPGPVMIPIVESGEVPPAPGAVQ